MQEGRRTVVEEIRGFSGYSATEIAWVDRGIYADWQTEFDVDLGDSLISFYNGYNPYNHIGKCVVVECIGVKL